MSQLQTPATNNTRPAESGHWYTMDGTPCYTMKGANGAERPTTLRDARKFDLIPSVTTIIGAAAKPGLERWKQEQVLHAALTLPMIKGESEKNYLERIWEDSRAQAAKAAERGTAIHAAIQGHYEGTPPDPSMWDYVKGAVDTVREWDAAASVPSTSWRVEATFAHPLGYGGKCDLNAETDGGGVVLDYKSKEFRRSDKEPPKLWEEHYMQLAAYRMGFKLDTARCAICFVSTLEPGYCVVVELEEERLRQGWVMFYHLLRFWQSQKNHNPGRADLWGVVK